MLEERRLQRAKVSLMRDSRFALWSGILMVGKTRVVDNLPTAATNGRDELYGREFVAELRDAELNFVVLHEALHKAFRHLTTWKKLHDEDQNLANCACDYVINLMLRDMDKGEQTIAFPRYKSGAKQGKLMGLIDEKYRGLNAKQVFDLLKQEKKRGGGGGGDKPDGFDEHDWDGAGEMSEEEKKELARDVDAALRQGLVAQQKIAGKGTGNSELLVEDLLKPKVDWREVLREFVSATCNAKDVSSWRKVNRRFLSGDVYMPTMIGERVGHIVLGIDTSGSISTAELVDFLSEVKAIAENVHPEKVDLLYWDSEVAGHEEYTDGDVANIVSSTRPVGGGGTSPSCVSQYLKDKRIEPKCVIMLTDGFVGGDWGSDWPCPVLWCIVDNPNAEAPNGKTVHIEGE